MIFIITSKNSLPDRHILKIVLRGERGFTTMLLLHHSSWNETPFQAKHKDRFLLLASDVGMVSVRNVFRKMSLDEMSSRFVCPLIYMWTKGRKTSRTFRPRAFQTVFVGVVRERRSDRMFLFSSRSKE